MRFLDHPLRFALGRTPRELMLLSIGAGFTVCEAAAGRGADPATLAVYALATLAFALRFFPSRAIGAGVSLGAIAQRWSLGGDRGMPYWIDWTAYVPLVMLVLLASRDLEERFDRAPSRIGWFPNRWAALPAREARLLRWCAYLAGALGGVFWRAWVVTRGQGVAPDAWPLAAVAALSACVVLLAHGRAAVLLALPPFAGALAWALAPSLSNAWAATFLDPRAHATCYLDAAHALPALFRDCPALALNGFALAVATALLATPYAIRLLRSTREN